MKKIILLLCIIIFMLNCGKEKYFPLENEGSIVVEKDILQASKGDDFYYNFKRNTGISSYLLLGQYKDEYKSRILLRFSSFPDSGAVIDTAKIFLYPQGNLGDDVAPFTANIYKINSEWDEYDIVNWGSPYIEADSLNLLGTAEITEDDSNRVAFDLDPSIVMQWMDTLSTEKNYGIWIDCENATFFKSFYSSEQSSSDLQPALRLKYSMSSDPDSSFLLETRATEDAFVITTKLNLDDELLYIGKGVAFRSWLKFDVQSIIDSLATLNRAELKLIMNNDYSMFDSAGVSNLLVMRVSSREQEQVEIDSTFSGFAVTSIIEDTVLVDVSTLVLNWVIRNPDIPNEGFLLQSSGEYLSIDRIAFYSSLADSINAPKLLLTYTLPPTNNFFNNEE